MKDRDNISVVIQKDDIKSKLWADAARDYSIEIIRQTGSAIFAPFFLLKYIFKYQRPKAYIVRYLNDYPRLLKTIIRTISEIGLVLICKVFKINIFWICHNVDKESSQNFPSISNFRRALIGRASKRIFVTDRLLVSYAENELFRYRGKIESISFGQIDGNTRGNGDQKSKEFLAENRNLAEANNLKFLAVLCAGAPTSKKSLHFSYLVTLIEKGRENGYHIAAIVSGNWDESEHCRTLIESYEHIPSILLFKEYIAFSSAFISSEIDFYFRSYDDYSVPFTIYEACSLGKPILSLNFGFLPQLIDVYRIGGTLNLNFSNIKQLLEKIKDSESFCFPCFLERNRWSSLGLRLSEFFDENEKG